MDTQQITQHSQSDNPIFESKEWFIPEFNRVVFIACEDFSIDSNIDYIQSYDIDSQFYLDYTMLFNTIIRGISPIAQLQYWDVQYKEWDSIVYQMMNVNKSFYVQSDNDYSTVVANYSTVALNNYNEYLTFLEMKQYDMLYIDSLKITNQELNKLIDEVESYNYENHNTIFLVLTFHKLFTISKSKIIGQQVRSHLEEVHNDIYTIDSIAASLSTLLNIPIPMQNHGMIIPGLVFEINDTKFNQNPQIISLYDFIMNQEQLYVLYTKLEKLNPYSKIQMQSLEQIVYQFNEINNMNISSQFALIEESRVQSQQLSQLINQEISGNIIVLLIGLGFSVTAIVLFMKQDDIDMLYVALVIMLSLFDNFIIIILTYIALQLWVKHFKPIQLGKYIIGLLYFVGNIFMQLFTLLMMLPFIKQAPIICQGIYYILIKSNHRVQFILVLILTIASYNSYIIQFINNILVLYLVRSQNLMICVASMLLVNIPMLDWMDILPICVLCSIKLQPDWLHKQIVFLSFILVSQPQLPNSPLILQLSAYCRVYQVLFYIVFFEIFQQIRQNFQSNLSDQLTPTMVVQSIYDLTHIDRSTIVQYCITLLLSEVTQLGKLVINEIIQYDTSMKTIAQQYFTLQNAVINLILLGILAVIIRQPDKPEQLKSVVTQNDEDMREIEL